jgi:hypothetical protein
MTTWALAILIELKINQSINNIQVTENYVDRLSTFENPKMDCIKSSDASGKYPEIEPIIQEDIRESLMIRPIIKPVETKADIEKKFITLLTKLDVLQELHADLLESLTIEEMQVHLSCSSNILENIADFNVEDQDLLDIMNSDSNLNSIKLLTMKYRILNGNSVWLKSFYSYGGIGILIENMDNRLQMEPVSELDAAALQQLLLCLIHIIKSDGLAIVMSTRGSIDAFVFCLRFEYKTLAMDVLQLLSVICNFGGVDAVWKIIHGLKNVAYERQDEKLFKILIDAMHDNDSEIQSCVLDFIIQILLNEVELSRRIEIRNSLHSVGFDDSCLHSIDNNRKFNVNSNRMSFKAKKINIGGRRTSIKSLLSSFAEDDETPINPSLGIMAGHCLEAKKSKEGTKERWYQLDNGVLSWWFPDERFTSPANNTLNMSSVSQILTNSTSASVHAILKHSFAIICKNGKKFQLGVCEERTKFQWIHALQNSTKEASRKRTAYRIRQAPLLEEGVLSSQKQIKKLFSVFDLLGKEDHELILKNCTGISDLSSELLLSVVVSELGSSENKSIDIILKDLVLCNSSKERIDVLNNLTTSLELYRNPAETNMVTVDNTDKTFKENEELKQILIDLQDQFDTTLMEKDGYDSRNNELKLKINQLEDQLKKLSLEKENEIIDEANIKLQEINVNSEEENKQLEITTTSLDSTSINSGENNLSLSERLKESKAKALGVEINELIPYNKSNNDVLPPSINAQLLAKVKEYKSRAQNGGSNLSPSSNKSDDVLVNEVESNENSVGVSNDKVVNVLDINEVVITDVLVKDKIVTSSGCEINVANEDFSNDLSILNDHDDPGSENYNLKLDLIHYKKKVTNLFWELSVLKSKIGIKFDDDNDSIDEKQFEKMNNNMHLKLQSNAASQFMKNEVKSPVEVENEGDVMDLKIKSDDLEKVLVSNIESDNMTMKSNSNLDNEIVPQSIDESEHEVSKFLKYEKMQNMNLPSEAVRQKMTMDGISSSDISEFLNGGSPQIDESEPKVSKILKYQKMRKINLPDLVIRQKMTMDGMSSCEISEFLDGDSPQIEAKIVEIEDEMAGIDEKKIVTPSFKMKPLFWTKMKPKETKNTIWNGLEESELNWDDMHDLFRDNNANNKDSNKSKEVIIAKKPKYISLFDQKRTQSVSIQIAKLRLSPKQIYDQIIEMNDKVLDAERTESFIHILPTSEECKIINAYEGELTELDTIGKLFKLLVNIPDLNLKLESFLIKLTWIKDSNLVNQSLENVFEAINELNDKSSKSSLLSIFSIIITIGNYLNGGTNRGQAYGIKLDSLLKLENIKYTSKTGNLLNYIAKEYKKLNVDLPKFYDNWKQMNNMSQVNLKEIKINIKGLLDGLSYCKKELDFIDKEDESKIQKLNEIIKEFELNYDNIIKKFEYVIEIINNTLILFGEPIINFNNTNCSCQEFFTILLKFTKTYKTAVEENEEDIIDVRLNIIIIIIIATNYYIYYE